MQRRYEVRGSRVPLVEQRFEGVYTYTWKGETYVLFKQGRGWLLTFTWPNDDMDYWEFRTVKAAREWLRGELQ